MAVDFFANGLCFYCDMAIKDLDGYRDFQSRLEMLWKNEDKSLQEEIDNVLRSRSDLDEQDVIDSYAWELHLHQSRFPEIHRSALVISLFVFLENQLNGLCHLLGRSMASNVSVEDVAGKGVERAFKYMSKVAQFDLGKVSRIAFLKDVNSLRNRLVHADGVLPEDEKNQLNRFVSKMPGLIGWPGKNVGIGSEFIDHLIDEFCKFFEELNAEISPFMSRVNQGNGEA